jgi:two-component system sensor histidine kinase AtoS
MDVSRLKELERLAAVKDIMHFISRAAAGMAHEMRDPLAGIDTSLSSLNALLDSGISSENDTRLVRQMMAQIRMAADEIKTAIKRVTDFEMPDTPDVVPTDIDAVIEDAVILSGAVSRKNRSV